MDSCFAAAQRPPALGRFASWVGITPHDFVPRFEGYATYQPFASQEVGYLT
jgi:hypothetical protein